MDEHDSQPDTAYNMENLINLSLNVNADHILQLKTIISFHYKMSINI